jgi:hypothetical protein
MELFDELKVRVQSVPRRTLALLGILFLSGAVFAFALRFVLVERVETHYHANFAVYVNGTREPFDSFTFYEEIASCSDGKNNPKARVHMHDQISHVVHVHDTAVTWGHLFESLSYGLSRKALVTDAGVFIDGVDGKELTFILNGKPVNDATGMVINSEDVLLVDYGDSSEGQLQVRYDEITKDADEYNKKPDPSACKGGQDEPLKDRFLRTLGRAEEH